jgi:uncharacterized phiE125 gp8 family phage protein
VDVKLINESAVEPIDPVFIANFVKFDDENTAETELIASLTKAARQAIENFCQRALVEKTYVVDFDADDMDGDYFTLPFAPISSVESVIAISEDGTETEYTLNVDYYVVGGQTKRIKISSTFVALTDESNTLYRVEYVCGYDSPDCETIPEELKIRIAETVAFWYLNRENVGSLPANIRGACYNYRIWSDL